MKSRLGYLIVILFTAQLALILLSWIVTAAQPDWNLHSLLSSEGIRWFFGAFVDNLLMPFFIWLVLIAIALGAFFYSRLGTALKTMWQRKDGKRGLQYRERMGLRIVAVELLVYIAIMILLTAVPHAILLSVTGLLFPSAFSVSIIPSLALTLLLMSLTYGVTSGTIDDMGKMVDALSFGVRWIANFLPLYIVGAQLYASVLYVIG